MKNLNLKIKLWFLVSVFVLSLSGLGILGVYSTNKMSTHLTEVIYNDLPLIQSLTLIDMVHDGVRGAVLQALLSIQENNLDSLSNAQNDLDEHKKNILNWYSVYQ